MLDLLITYLKILLYQLQLGQYNPSCLIFFLTCNNFQEKYNINLLLTKREGRTAEYWPEVVAVQKRPMANIPQYGSS